MADDVFTTPEGDAGDWVDVRMTNPEAGEWDVDLVVVDGEVSYLDLRIRRELLAGFVECLIDDIGTDQALSILTELADRNDIDFPSETADD